MTRNEIILLLGKASAAFSNSAPNFKQNPQIFNEYAEALENMDAKTAFANYEKHRDTGEFFPSIAVLKKAERICGDIRTLEETQALLLEMEEMERNAVPMPEHIRLKFEARKALPPGGVKE